MGYKSSYKRMNEILQNYYIIGPNHAADPIVTRWKRNEKGEKVLNQATNLPILQFVAVQRRDTKEWAIPGVKFHNNIKSK
jgi:hypothetical protein